MIEGLDEVTRKLKELETAVSALDGEIGSVSFDPQDPQSIELAIQKMEAAIDERVGDYRNNDMVQGIISEMKERYREAILERAAAARSEKEGHAVTIKTALRELNNAVLDLQSADYNTFERPLARLSQALNGADLKDITERLKATADFESFLENANQGGSMMGSARLNWPADRREELGLVIKIIERGAKEPHWFLSLAHTYYYSGRKIVGDIRKITAAVIIPFNRGLCLLCRRSLARSASSRHGRDSPWRNL